MVLPIDSKTNLKWRSGERHHKLDMLLLGISLTGTNDLTMMPSSNEVVNKNSYTRFRS